MKPGIGVRSILVVLLVSSIMVSVGSNMARAQSQPNVYRQTSKSAIRVGSGIDQESTLQARRLLENKGILYDIVADSDASSVTMKDYDLILVLGSTLPQLNSDLTSIVDAVESGTGLIWIGQGLPESLYEFTGLIVEDTAEIERGTVWMECGNASTQLYDETIELVASRNASTRGFFVDKSDQIIAPAELSFKRGTAGLTYYFAYDAFSWWFSDEENPWLRAYRVHVAVEDVLSEHATVRLLPYPRGMKSAFVTRIEDVDPLHTNQEWLDRGAKFQSYYADKNAPLTVSLTPTHVDPELGLNLGIEEPTAHGLKGWLSKVLMGGGTIVEHGYTHQIGNAKTGVSPEFFDETTQTWLSLENQKLRIATAARQIRESLGFSPKGFEAPHYVANQDTYRALSELGFLYVTQNSNTAFFDRFNLDQGLVNIPETLGYIPIDAGEDLKVRIESNMDYLCDMSGVMLYFNHLFNDQMLQTGKELLDYAQSKGNVWITNTDNLADFWTQRYRAYQGMTIDTSSNLLTLELGPSDRAGLTLAVSNAPQIEGVEINGVQWPVFNGDQVILPALTESSNTIAITFGQANTNSNQIFGYPLVVVSFFFSVLIVLRTPGYKKTLNPSRDWRKNQ